MGRHLLKTYTRKQKIIARSSSEAELYQKRKGVESMMCDLGFAVRHSTDQRCKSNRTHSTSAWNREMKHIDVAHLWLQNEVKSNTGAQMTSFAVVREEPRDTVFVAVFLQTGRPCMTRLNPVGIFRPDLMRSSIATKVWIPMVSGCTKLRME